MYMHEVTYDLNELFRMNYHIHTSLSRCGRKEMTLEAIIKEAEKAGLSEIAITDHIHPGESAKVFRNDKILRTELENIPHTIKVYLGAELSAYGKNKYTLQYSDFDRVEYRLYSHNHYQMDGWELPDEQTPLSYKQHMKQCLEKIIRSGKADCLAHPFLDNYAVREFEDRYPLFVGCVTSVWTDNELGDILSLGKEHSCAWEINTSAIQTNPEFAKRYFHIGKEVGVCFNIGTDAHTLNNVDTFAAYKNIKDIFGA